MKSGKSSILTREEQYELARRIRENNEEAYHELVTRNMPLVHSQAKKFGGVNLLYPDLIQEGYVGLCKAAKSYNPVKYRTAFSTYALRIIRNEMLNAIEDSRFQVRVPNWVFGLLKKIGPELERCRKEDRELDVHELSKKYRVGEDTMRKVLRLSGGSTVRLSHSENGRREGIENALDELVTYDGSERAEGNRTENLRRSISEACKRRKISDRNIRILAV